MPSYSPLFVNGAPWQQRSQAAAPSSQLRPQVNPNQVPVMSVNGGGMGRWDRFEGAKSHNALDQHLRGLSQQQYPNGPPPLMPPRGPDFAGYTPPTNKPMQNPFLPGNDVSAWSPQSQGQQAPAGMPPDLPGLPQQQMMFAPNGMGGNQQPRGGNILEYLAGAQLGNFMGSGQRVADDINGSWGALQQSMTNAADRQEREAERKMRERMFSQLAKALGVGGGSDSISDTASPLRVGNGTVTTNINAQPLSMADILRADDNVRNTPVGNYDGVRSYSPGPQGELNQLMQGGVRSNAPNVERVMTDQNAQFGRDIQGARSSQFMGLGGLLAALQGDRISRQGQNVRSLMGMIA